MLTLTIPVDLESILAQAAQQRGVEAEKLALEILREKLAPEKDISTCKATLFDLLADGIGAVAGSPEAWSERSGQRFAEGLSNERRLPDSERC